jgi:hypothetical protein
MATMTANSKAPSNLHLSRGAPQVSRSEALYEAEVFMAERYVLVLVLVLGYLDDADGRGPPRATDL